LGAVILFFDQVNTPVSEQAEVRRSLARSYRERQTLAIPTCVVLYTGSELRLLAQPTYDPAMVAAAIDKIQITIKDADPTFLSTNKPRRSTRSCSNRLRAIDGQTGAIHVDG